MHSVDDGGRGWCERNLLEKEETGLQCRHSYQLFLFLLLYVSGCDACVVLKEEEIYIRYHVIM